MSRKGEVRRRTAAPDTISGGSALEVPIGLFGVVVGAVGGLIVGANIGGNWVTSVSIAGLNGHEFAGLVGAVVGGVLCGSLALWVSLHRRNRRG